LVANQAEAKFQGSVWNYIRVEATKNFKDRVGYLGWESIDCIEVFRLDSGKVADATEYKEFFVSMFAHKGYQIRVGFICEKDSVGMSPSVREQWYYVFHVCMK